jgi:hypothetical protein
MRWRRCWTAPPGSGAAPIEAVKDQRVDVPVFGGMVEGVTEARSSVVVR